MWSRHTRPSAAYHKPARLLRNMTPQVAQLLAVHIYPSNTEEAEKHKRRDVSVAQGERKNSLSLIMTGEPSDGTTSTLLLATDESKASAELRRQQEDGTQMPGGTFRYLRRQARWRVYLAMGCDVLAVAVCSGLLDRGLYDGLRGVANVSGQSHDND